MLLVVQWNSSIADTMGLPLHVWIIDIRISEASGIFPVGVAMHTRAVEARSRALPCCTLAKKADQRLQLCEPMLNYYNMQLLNRSAVVDKLA